MKKGKVRDQYFDSPGTVNHLDGVVAVSVHCSIFVSIFVVGEKFQFFCAQLSLEDVSGDLKAWLHWDCYGLRLSEVNFDFSF